MAAVSPLPTHNSSLSHLSPLVIPTGAKRSGGICSFSPSHSQLPLESPLSPCHPDRSVPGFLLRAASSDHVRGPLKSFPARVPEQRIPNQTPTPTRFPDAGGQHSFFQQNQPQRSDQPANLDSSDRACARTKLDEAKTCVNLRQHCYGLRSLHSKA
jgi:hypothetical protein